MRPLRSRQEKALKWVISCCERDRTVRLLRSRQEKALKWLVSCYERDRTVRLLRSRRRRVGFRPAAAIRVALPGGGRNPMTATAGGLMGGCSRRGGAAARFRRNRVAEPPTGTKWRSHVPRGTGAKRRGGGNGSIEKGPSRVRRPFFGGASRIRTGDPLLAKQVLYQLSYNPGDVPGPWGRGEGTKKAGLASGL